MERPAIEFGISCLHYRWDTLDEAFRRAQDEFGLGLIEFSTNRVAEEDYRACKQMAADRDMELSLHAWENLAALAAAAGIEAMRANLDVCLAMGAVSLIAHMGSNPSRGRGVQTVADVCAAVAEDYEEAEVNICLENHYSFDHGGLYEIGGTPDDFLAVFTTVDSPVVRFCLDYGHSHMCQNTTAFVEQLASHLVYTHIADNKGEHDDHLAFGEGTVDWDTAIRTTLRTGFEGPFIIEFPEWGKGAVRFREFMDFVVGLAGEEQPVQ